MVSAPRTARRIATAIARGGVTRAGARSSCRSRRSARAATSRRSCSRASAASRRWCLSCSRPMCAASRPVASISSLRASGCGSPSPRSAGSPACSTSRSRRSVSGRWKGAIRICSSTPRSRRSETAADVARKCVVIAHAVHETGRREIIGLDVGETETEAFWREFLRSLVARGLVGVQLAISDAHPGLKAALATVLGAPWQRCTVHFLRDLRGHVRRDQHDALGAIIRSIFTAPDGDEARRRLRDAVGQLERRLPKGAALREGAGPDVSAFSPSPPEHWPKTRRTNPFGRLNREIARRTDVVGIFPDDASLIRLVSMLAIEANDEWLVGRAYISLKSM